MKWSKSKSIVLGVSILGIATIAFSGSLKDRAGRLFDWWLGGVKQMELYDGKLRVDEISDIADTGSPDFVNGLNLDGEPTLVAEYMTATTATGTPAAGKFYSAIVGRQPILDLSKIPSGKHGIERLGFNQKTEVTGETSLTTGRKVYSLREGDDRLRAYGETGSGMDFYGGLRNNDSGTNYLGVAGGGDIEIVFYGTGLNYLNTYQDSNERGFDAYLDGVFLATTSIDVDLNTDNVLVNRKYSQNQVYPVVSGLTLGIHTVTIKSTHDMFVAGFEILNEATTVAIPAGSIVDNGKIYTTTATTDDLTTFAAEYQDGAASGSSTKGGHVVRYFDTDGTIKKDINYADSTQLNLGAASHANEEVVKTIWWREFGVGRSDDFTTLNAGGSNTAFTMDDGTTTLVSDTGVRPSGVGGLEHTGPSHSIITFVGTGLDIDQDIIGSVPTIGIYVDGVSIGALAATSTRQRLKLVSGLPFGTHTVKIDVTSVSSNWDIYNYYVYAPKKPTLTAGQVEIDSTYKMADFSANATAGILFLSEGTIWKSGTREAIYDGGFSGVNIQPARTGGFEITSATASASIRRSFFGTGFVYRSASNAGNTLTVELDDDGSGFQNLNSTNFPTATTSSYGGLSFSLATQKITQSVLTEGSGVIVNDLPLGMYTVKITNDGAVHNRFAGFAIITPTYSYKNNLLNLSDAVVGSNSLKNEILIPGATKKKIIATAGTEGIATSGSYTPFIPNSANMDAVGTPGQFFWNRVGNMVTVIGIIDGHDPKADSSCEVSLPPEALPTEAFVTANLASGTVGDHNSTNAVHPFGDIRAHVGKKTISIGWRTSFNPNPFPAALHFSYVIDY